MHKYKYVNQALSLLGGQIFGNSSSSRPGSEVQQSPFFDPEFWNNDFEKRKTERKKQLTVNLREIELMDYAELEEDDIKTVYSGWEADEEKMLCGLASASSELSKKKHRKIGTMANIDEDMDRVNTVTNHAKAVTKLRLQKFARKEMFISDIQNIFDPKYNKKWINALVGDDDENVLHLVDDYSSSHKRQATYNIRNILIMQIYHDQRLKMEMKIYR